MGVADMAMYKVNVSLPEDLVSEIDITAEGLGMSRSGFIAEASARYLTELKNLSAEEVRRQNIDRAFATFRRIGATLPVGAADEMIEQLRRSRECGMPERRSE